jgi:hypothetical protein
MLAVSIFSLACLGIAQGKIPGLAIDRVGGVWLILPCCSRPRFFLGIIMGLADRLQWDTLAVSSKVAGNLFLLGSIANLIVMEQASTFGIRISFLRHAAVGVPVSLFSLLILWGGSAVI